MVLDVGEKEFFAEHGYLRYGRVLSDEEVSVLKARSEDIVDGRLSHMPVRYVQSEKQFRDGAGDDAINASG